MHPKHASTPSARLLAAALCATLATAGTGLAATAAFADEGAPEGSQQSQAQHDVSAFSLTWTQTEEDAAFAGIGAAQPSLGVGVAATNDTAAATKLYEAVEAYRAESGLGALARDAALEAAAYQRTAELGLLEASIRPDGSYFDTASPDPDLIYGEIAVSAPEEAALSAADVLEQAKATASAWMLTDATLVGMGAACSTDADGTTHWVLLFSYGASDPATAPAPAVDGKATYRVPVALGNLTLGAIGSDMAVDLGATKVAPMPVTTGGTLPHAGGEAVLAQKELRLAAGDYTWNSSNPNIASVDAWGTVTGVADGTCTVSAVAGETQYFYTVAVGDGQGTVYDLAECTVTGIMGSYEYTGEAIVPAFSVAAPTGKPVAETQYTYAFENNVGPGTATLTVTAAEGATAVTGTLVKTFEIPAPQHLVPNVLGWYAEAAAGTLEDAGFEPYLASGDASPDELSAGMIYKTDPAPDTWADAGSTVTLLYYGAYVAPEPAEPANDEGQGGEGDPADGDGAGESDGMQPEGIPEGDGAHDDSQGEGDDVQAPEGMPEGGDAGLSDDEGEGDPNGGTNTGAPEGTPENNGSNGEGDGMPTGDEGPEGDVPAQGDDESTAVDLAAAATLTLDAAEYELTDGTPVEPAVTVTLEDGTALQQGVDYEVAYANNGQVSTDETYGVVTVSGIGAYTGSLTASFTVVEPEPQGIDLAGAGWSIAAIDDQFYVGLPIEPAAALVNNGEPEPLVPGTDYTVSYQNNDAPGAATVTVTGQGLYSGTLQATFQINGDIAQGGAVSAIADQTYTGADLTPPVTVTYGEKNLVEGTDYVLEYANNRNAGTASVTVIGTGNFMGSIAAQFAIAPKAINGAQIAPVASVNYAGAPYTPAITVTDGGTVLASGTDYTVTYENNLNAGTAHVVAAGTGNYTGSVDTTFVIAPLNMNQATVVMPNMFYTGSPLEPQPVSVTVGSLTLAEGTDYTVASYANNVQVGDATVTLQGKGNFTGTATADWKVVAQGSTTESSTTQTLPPTGDATNVAAIGAIAVGGIALIGAAIALIMRLRRKR